MSSFHIPKLVVAEPDSQGVVEVFEQLGSPQVHQDTGDDGDDNDNDNDGSQGSPDSDVSSEEEDVTQIDLQLSTSAFVATEKEYRRLHEPSPSPISRTHSRHTSTSRFSPSNPRAPTEHSASPVDDSKLESYETVFGTPRRRSRRSPRDDAAPSAGRRPAAQQQPFTLQPTSAPAAPLADSTGHVDWNAPFQGQ